jgi:hypothetical protein
MLFALTASILPLYQKASQNVPYVQLRNAAESAINLAVADLNNSIENGAASVYDDPTAGLPYTTKYYIPPGVNAPTVKITVKNEFPPSSSLVYNREYDTSIIGSASPVGQQDSYRIVEAIAYFDAGSAPQVMARSVVRLSPVQTDNPPSGPSISKQTSFLTGTNGSQNTKPVFNYAAFGINGIALGPSTIVHGYDSRGGNPKLAGDIGTNGTATLTGSGIEIDGSLTVSSPTISPYNSAKVATSALPPLIHDQLIVNGTADGRPVFQGTNGPGSIGPQPGDTVRGESRGFLDISFKPIITSGTLATNMIPPSPSVPDTAHALTAPQNGQQIVFANSASYPPSTAALSAYQAGGTLNLPPGDYSFNSLSVGADGSNSSIRINSGVSQPVRLFVDGNSTSEVSLMRNGARNGSSNPANLQLYYSGSNPVTLSSTFNGVLYAPNAAVNVGSSSGSLDVYGSIVGSSVHINNTRLNFDAALSDAAYLNNSSRPNYNKASNLSYAPSRYQALNAATPGYFSSFQYRVLSYQEVKNPQP